MPFSRTTDLLREALALQRRGAVAEAAARYGEVLRADPDNADAYYYLGMISCQAGRFDEGVEFARKALTRDIRHPNAHILLGRALSALGRHDEAITSLQLAVVLAPDLAAAHSHLADLFSDLGRKAEAIQSYDRALALTPNCVDDWFNRGLALHAVGRQEEALGSFDRAIAANPELARAHLERANVLWRLHRLDEALKSVDIALVRYSGLAEAWHSRGIILHDLGDYDGALAAYDKALALKPDLVESWLGRRNALKRCRRYEEALVADEKALARKPELAEAWLGRASLFYELKRFDEAFAACDKALALKPDLAEAWLGRGNLFYGLKRFDEAFAAYDKALALKPDLAEAWLAYGDAYIDLKQYDDALAAYERAVSLRPNLEYADGARLHAKMRLCDWTKIETEIVHLISAVKDQKLLSVPFVLLSIPASSADQLQCAKAFAADHGSFAALWRGQIYSHERIRIGYFSADFRSHPVAQLAVGLFEHHDKTRFEVMAIAFGTDDGSDLRSRIRSATEHFIDVHIMPDSEVAELVRDREIDILVDLSGFTQGNRFSVLARRAAPLQVNFLGYPGTMGAACMDYIIADPIIIPKDHFAFYSEKVVWLPDTYQANDRSRPISLRHPTRSDCNLPDAAFVFCCFNAAYKISPEVFAVWMRLLAKTQGTVLWLLQTNPTAGQNLRREAEAYGISPQRLIFAPGMPVADHMARIGLADLFLDTLPYNAHTTASDALWAGLPVLTCLGKTFAGRVAASLLQAIGVPELITTSLEDYEILALKLARDSSFLQAIKAKLVRNRDTCPLFDAARYARHIEAAYVTMWERYQRRETPEAFAVSPKWLTSGGPRL